MAGSLVCYTVESGSDSDEEMDIKPELETVQHTPTEVVNTILVELLDSVFTGTRDFSDMYIKEEPIDPDDIKEEFDQDYRDGIKVEIDSDDCESDSDDSSDCSSVIAEVPDIKQEGNRLTQIDFDFYLTLKKFFFSSIFSREYLS